MELVLGIALCVVMGKLAANSKRSAIGWFFITFALCAASLLLPLPFLRFLIAGVVVFLIMTFTNK